MRTYRKIIYFIIFYFFTVSNASFAQFESRKYICIHQEYVAGVSIIYYFANKSKSDLIKNLIEKYSENQDRISIRDIMLRNAEAIYESMEIAAIDKSTFSEKKVELAETKFFSDCMMRRKTDLEEIVKIFYSIR